MFAVLASMFAFSFQQTKSEDWFPIIKKYICLITVKQYSKITVFAAICETYLDQFSNIIYTYWKISHL